MGGGSRRPPPRCPTPTATSPSRPAARPHPRKRGGTPSSGVEGRSTAPDNAVASTISRVGENLIYALNVEFPPTVPRSQKTQGTGMVYRTSIRPSSPAPGSHAAFNQPGVGTGGSFGHNRKTSLYLFCEVRLRPNAWRVSARALRFGLSQRPQNQNHRGPHLFFSRRLFFSRSATFSV